MGPPEQRDGSGEAIGFPALKGQCQALEGSEDEPTKTTTKTW